LGKNLTHPDPGSQTGTFFACWYGAPPSGLSRNQLQLLNDTPNERKKQRIRARKTALIADY
jgi:hypothetical protein